MDSRKPILTRTRILGQIWAPLARFGVLPSPSSLPPRARVKLAEEHKLVPWHRRPRSRWTESLRLSTSTRHSRAQPGSGPARRAGPSCLTVIRIANGSPVTSDRDSHWHVQLVAAYIRATVGVANQPTFGNEEPKESSTRSVMVRKGTRSAGACFTNLAARRR